MSIYNVKLQEQVRELMASSKMAQARAAEVMGVNKGFLCLFLGDKPYNGDIAFQESKMTAFFKLNDEKQKQNIQAQPFLQDQLYVPISVSEDICKFIKYCHITKGIMSVQGDAGIGKTKASERYEMENPSSTIYVESTQSNGGLRETMKMLARKLKISDRLNTVDLSLRIQEKLKLGNKILIIDEAQHLKYETLEEIIHWGDPQRFTGKPSNAILLMGNQKITSKMKNDKSGSRDQQSNRIKNIRIYNASNAVMEDVEKLFPYLKENNMEKELSFLLAICQSKEGVRSAINLYNNAVALHDVSYGTLLNAAVQMNIDVLG